MTLSSEIINCCRGWARRVQNALGTEGLFVFGSVIHRSGMQFIPTRSDLDAVIVIPDRLKYAPARTEWLIQLQGMKQKLELSLFNLLSRKDPSKPIVSLLAVKKFEIHADVHKSSAPSFFSNNLFLNLLRNRNPAPLRRSKQLRVDDRTKEVLEFTQHVRNEFLGISASGKPTLATWNDSLDPIPKRIMRYSAVASNKGTDIQHGLDEIFSYLYLQKDFDPSYMDLYNWLSIRRGARGQRTPLSPNDYLLFTETVLDMGNAHKPSRRLMQRRVYERRVFGSEALTYINGYKLFYFRRNHNFTLPALARKTGIATSLLKQLERINPRRGSLDPSLWFAPCDRDMINRLEETLDAHGRLETGKADDFLTRYMIFYDRYKAASPSDAIDQETQFQTKAVVFDFDGTLTEPADNLTTWEMIWVALGYQKQLCFELHTRYQREEFSHKDWCQFTLDAFKAAKLRREDMVKISKTISLVDGVAETLQKLSRSGIKLFILSGSIKAIIRLVLGNLYDQFELIKANELIFDESGDIERIEGTDFDFQGKATFIKRIIQDYGLDPSDVLFVGNDCNDVFASQSGARTLCVNPRHTDPANEDHWTYAIGEMTNINQILRFV